MNLLIDLYWPVCALGLLAGTIGATIMFRRKQIGLARLHPLAPAYLVAAAGALLWIGPLGAADRFVSKVDRSARLTLDFYEVPMIDGRLERAPLRRNLLLAGPADDFQTSELARLFSQLPGVKRAEWKPTPSLPVWIEALAAAAAGFLLGMGLAYLFELHRRYNAQWKW